MTSEDFSSGFDLLLGSYTREAGYGEEDSKASVTLDEYEKSLFLTKFQHDFVVALYAGRDPFGAGFEETEELRRYLASLIDEAELEPVQGTGGKPLGIDGNSKFFTLPSDLWFITYESVLLSEGKCEGHTTQEVVPVSQDEYHRIRKNPFRGANDRRALRLDLKDSQVEIVSRYPVSRYYVRYLRKLRPIILADLPDGLTIEGVSEETPCELHEALHQRILEGAVQMALQSRGHARQGNTENN